jgi:hypothetical protein
VDSSELKSKLAGSMVNMRAAVIPNKLIAGVPFHGTPAAIRVRSASPIFGLIGSGPRLLSTRNGSGLR